MTTLTNNTAIRIGIIATAFALVAGCASGPKAPINFDTTGYQGDKSGFAEKYVDITHPKYLKKVDRVVIPSFQVEFITESGASAAALGGLGSKSSTRVTSKYKLTGLENEQLQSVTDRLYQDLIARLNNIGIEVVSMDELKQNKAWATLLEQGNVSPSQEKSRLEPNSGQSLVFTPTGANVYYSMHDPKIGVGGMLKGIGSVNSSTAPRSLEGQLMDEFDAMLLKARYVISFAQMSSEGGTFANNAEVSANWRFALAPKTTELTIATEFDKYKAPFSGETVYRPKLEKGSKVLLKSPVLNAAPFVTSVEDVTSTGTKVAEGILNALSVLGSLSGMGTRTTKYREYAVNVDASTYQQCAEQYITTVSEMFVERIASVR